MNLAVFSDTILPTLPTGQHGLGRAATDIADGLARAGHTVTLYAGLDSESPNGVYLVEHACGETERAHIFENTHDVIIDLSHAHDLSRLHPDWPIINAMADLECRYQPPNAVVFTEYQRHNMPHARRVPLGIDVDRIPFHETPDNPLHVVYCAKIHPFKGFDIALQAATLAGMPIHFAGRNYANADLPSYIGEINDNAGLYAFLGGAAALLAPSRQDAGGRVILEAAAGGTPTITLDCTGSQYHVKDGVSGFVVSSPQGISEAIGDLPLLSRSKAREWVTEHHALAVMTKALEGLAQAVFDGERW